ncbi:MAG: asparagine synthase (glutamine-hydrolyzing) [Proteobacteria bacterium]|nr:asparagine synthase (glutamine-hydrolyzing) [Pseudomonadota bacterium]
MCGICGKIYFDSYRPVDERLIRQMTDVLQHRGPDDSGVFVSGSIGLGHRRLSIIDLSAAGRQPMANEDGSLQIVLNGEIYNYKELRPELEAQGHIFSSQTDTEVVVHLYEQEGPACVQRLRGMFAFAVWDARRQELFLARDRVGKKPLSYAIVDGSLIFASELKSLLKDPALASEVDPVALHHYLTYQYVPGPQTIFKGVHKLPPAHTLLLRNGNIKIQRYWQLSYTDQLQLPQLEDYCDQLRHVFTEAVKIRLRSDVPLGAFLSGGVDSSATVAVMAQLLDRPVKTFSIGFDDKDFDELQYAGMVARQYGTEHTEFVVRPEAVKILPTLIYHYDEPYADSSAIPTYYVSKLTREHVTVALNGDGGDESFAGYERYWADALAARYEHIPRLLREAVRGAANLLPYREHRWSFSRRLRRFLNGVADEPARRYVRWLCYFSNDMKDDLYSAAFKQAMAGHDSVSLTEAAYAESNAPTLLEKQLYADVTMYLPYDLLVKVDIASMANSLEARSPFLDHKVMEFAARLPAHLKLRSGQGKFLLKKAFEPMLPREVLYRKKMGFGVPISRWLRSDLKQPAYDILLDSRTIGRGYFKREAVQQLLDDHVSMRADHSYRLWALLWLELWQRMFVDKSDVLGL